MRKSPKFKNKVVNYEKKLYFYESEVIKLSEKVKNFGKLSREIRKKIEILQE